MATDDTDWMPLSSGQDWQSLPPQKAAAPDWSAMSNKVVDDPERAAGAKASLIASLLPNDQDQINAFAKARGINPARYGVVNGHIVYMDDNGDFVRETPSITGASGIIDGAQRIGKWSAANARTLADGAAGAVGGIATAPFAGGIPGAGAAAAVTDAGAQYLGHLLNGDNALEAAKNTSLTNAAGQGLLNAGGQAVGNLMSAGARAIFDTNPLRAAGYDASKLMDPANRAEWQKIADAAAANGITLTPGELTGAKSLLVAQRQLGRMDNVGSSSQSPMDILSDMYRDRANTQIPNYLQKVAGSISPTPGLLGADSLRNGANAVIQGLEDARSAASSPLYNAAMNNPANTLPPSLTDALLSFEPLAGHAVDKVRANPVLSSEISGSSGVPDGSLRVLDLAKRHLDDMYQASSKAGNANEARIIQGAKDNLVGTLDGLFPDYQAARAAYANASQPVDAAKEGLIGLLTRDNKGMSDVVKGATPFDIQDALMAFGQTGQKPAWNAGLRGYLEDALDKAQTLNADGSVGNVAGKLNKNLAPTPRAQTNLMTALDDPAHQESVGTLQDILGAAARAPAEGSPTATDLGKNGQNLAGFWPKTLNAVMNLGEFWELPDKVRMAVMARSGANNAADLAKTISGPNAYDALTSMRMLPTDADYLMLLLGQQGTDQGYDMARARRPNAMPSVMRRGAP